MADVYTKTDLAELSVPDKKPGGKNTCVNDSEFEQRTTGCEKKYITCVSVAKLDYIDSKEVCFSSQCARRSRDLLHLGNVIVSLWGEGRGRGRGEVTKDEM